MPFVLDASAALSCLFMDAAFGQQVGSLLVRLGEDEAVAPAVFMAEVLNVLVKTERRERGKSEYLEDRLLSIHNMNVRIDPETALHLETTTLSLARTHRLSIFDATYLELAIRRALPLATFDSGLIRGAQAERVALLP